MSKFKVGDIIVGKKSSNAIYGCTSKEHNWVGKVLLDLESELDLVEVVTLESDEKEYMGEVCYVNPKYFKLKKPELVEIDISKRYVNKNCCVLLFDGYVMFSIVDKLTLYIGEGLLSFKQAKKMLKVLGYKLIDSSKNKVMELKRDQAKYGLSNITLDNK